MIDNFKHETGLRLVAGSLILGGMTAASGAWANAGDCSPQDGAEFICGVANIEKLVPVDGTRWAVGSAIPGGPSEVPPLYFMNLDTHEIQRLAPSAIMVEPDTTAYPGCDQPDFAKVESVGIDVRDIGGEKLLYMVNHGGRMTTEIFELATDEGLPGVTWRGCIAAPDQHWFLDDVAIFADGGLVATSLFDPADPDFLKKLTEGVPYGKLGVWRPDSGWSEIPVEGVSGPNGVAITADEKQVFFADWAGKGVARVDLVSGEMSHVDLDFLVDNVMWTEDGSKILAGGQAVTAAEAFDCFLHTTGANCEVPFTLVAIDPVTLDVTPIHGPAMLGVMGSGTGALQDGGHLWLTSFRSDRIAKIPFAAE